ncbi:MAG: leucine-rich repeat protein, partial [Muribaculaceae bacterium]
YRTGLESLDLTNIESDLLSLSGYYTFAACEKLKTITAKGKVRFTGLYTFQDCKALETATFTGSGEDYTIMNPDIFKYCDNLKSVEFYHLKGNGQSNDMDSVFTGCKSLERVTSTCTPEISKIGYSCFDGCTSLKTLSLPETEFAVNETAFRNCAALESFDFTNVTSIGKGSFSGCTGLETVSIVKPDFAISETAFENCTALTSFDFAKVTSIGKGSFKGCVALTDAAHISNVSTIGEGSFEGCTGLTSLDFVNLTSIGSKAFIGCSALASISIKSESNNPPTVENEDAFDESHYATTEVDVLDEKYSDFAADAIWSKFDKLKHPAMFVYEYDEAIGGYSISKAQYALDSDFAGMLEVPKQYNSGNVVAIAEEAFMNLTTITGVTLPEGLTSIGANAFYGCKSIGTVVNKRATPVECDESVFEASVYSAATLYVPFGSLDAYKNTLPWSKFATIKQGFGDRIFDAPKASNESGVFNQSFELTLTNPNVIGEIYYYIVLEGEDGNVVHDVYTYTDPIKIASTCTVVAYVSDGTNCCEPVSLEFTRQYVGTENGLDKVLSANDNEEYTINTALFGHYHDGTYLYASTMGNSGSSKNTFNEDKKSEELSDNEEEFNQEDWVAIAGLTSDFVGQEIESGNVATVVSNTAYPVISFQEGVTSANGGDMGINTFRVENFNIHAENDAVSNIWLVAPQPAEYCSVKGYVKTANVNAAEGYLVLQSAESATTNEENAEIEPLTMNVFYDAATISLDADGWYYFAGIVSKESDALKFTALTVTGKPTGIEDVDAGTARIVAANGNINVAADKQTTIAVYSANGQLVAVIEASSATIAVTPGFYIVKVGNQVTKLAVR